MIGRGGSSLPESRKRALSIGASDLTATRPSPIAAALLGIINDILASKMRR